MEVNEKMMEAEFNSLLAAASLKESEFIDAPFRKEFLEFALKQSKELERLRRVEHDYKSFRSDIEELLNANIKIEEKRRQSTESYLTRAMHRYAKSICETLQADIHLAERKYNE